MRKPPPYDISQPDSCTLAERTRFIGNVTPAAALDLIVEKANDFAVGQGMASLYAVRPKVMDYAPLTALHNLVPAHPKLNVTLHRETAALVVWEIVYVAVPANT